MATLYGPKINTSNLVLALDAASANSYFSGSTNWVDISGNGNNGLIFNNPTYLTSSNGNLLFNSGSYVQISSSATLSDLTVGSNITIMGWVKRTIGSGSWLPIIAKVSSSGADNINYELAYTGTGSITSSVNAYCFSYRNSANTAFHGFSTEGGFEDDVWHHVAFTYTMATGSSAKFYIDGLFVTGSWKNGNGNEAPLNTNNGPIYIAKTNVDNEFFTGSIGSLQLFNRILSPFEIENSYKLAGSRFPSTIPTYYSHSFIENGFATYNVIVRRQLSNAYLLVCGKGTPSGATTPWTASFNSFITSQSLVFVANVGGRQFNILGRPLGNLPAATYSGSITGATVFGGGGQHCTVTIFENVRQNNSTYAGSSAGGFIGNATVNQPCTYGDMAFMWAGKIIGTLSYPDITIINTESDDWRQSTGFRQNFTRGSTTLTLSQLTDTTTNTVLTSTAIKKLQ